MDWGAIGAVAAIAGVVIAIFQLRKTVSSKNSSDLAIIREKPARISYRLVTGHANLANFSALNVDFDDRNWAAFEDIKFKLKHLEFAHISLCNEEEFPASRVYCRIATKDLLDARVETSRKLSKSAVMLEKRTESLTIKIEELPAGDRIDISVISSGHIGWSLEPLNASIDLKVRHV